MEPTEEPPPRFSIAISECVVVVGIMSVLLIVLFPAVHAARTSHGMPAVLPWLAVLVDDYPMVFFVGIPSAACLLTGLCLALFRRQLPRRWKRCFPWFKPKSKPIVAPNPAPIVLIDDARPAIVSLIASATGTVLLLVALMHMRSDRTHRRPVITWEGPLADYVAGMFGAGWGLSVLGMIVGAVALSRFRSRYNGLAVVSQLIGGGNLVWSCVITAGLYED